MRSGFAWLALLLPSAAAASGGQARAIDAAPAVTCELHVWPTRDISAMTMDFSLTGKPSDVDSAIHGTGDSRRTVTLSDILAPGVQLSQLSSIDLSGALKIPRAAIVVHDTMLDPDALKGKPARHSNSQAGCYYELVVRQIAWTHHGFYHPILHVDFALLDFGPEAVARKKHFGFGEKSLSHFFARAPDTPQTRDDELREMFKTDFLKFAGA